MYRSLEQKWDQASGAAHMFLVGLAKDRDQRGFLNGYAVCIGNSHANNNCKKRYPISKRQAQPDESDESSGVGGMTDVAIRSRLYDRLAELNGYIICKKPPQHARGIKTKGQPYQHEDYPGKEESSSLPHYGCLWEYEGKREAQSQC